VVFVWFYFTNIQYGVLSELALHYISMMMYYLYPEYYLGNDPRDSGGFDLTFKTLSEKCNSPSENRGKVESHDRNSSAHDRSVDLAFRNDFLNLSTNREWNLFILLSLPVPFGFGTVQFTFAGLDINDDCEFLDEAREICGLDVFRFMGCIG